MSESVHVVEVFIEDESLEWGWQCFTCGATVYGLDTMSQAEQSGDEHEASAP